jgi:methanogen extracellular protein (TIGR04279 family)
MGGKLVLPLMLMLMFPISSIALDNSSRSDFNATESQGRIDLEGGNALMVPNMSLSTDRTYLFDSLPVYSANESINGTFSLSQENGSYHIYALSRIEVCVSPFNISEYTSGLSESRHFAAGDCVETHVESNDNGNASFSIPKKPAGMYTLYIVDENKSAIISKQPFLVTEGEVALEMNYNVTSLEPFIRIKMNSTVLENQSKFFAAFMIPMRDYENVSLNLSENKTTDGLDMNLAIGSKSMQTYGSPRISSELLMNLLPLLPPNSAIGLQESNQPGVDLILMADQPWSTGYYVMTCGIYSPKEGLIGIKQTNVEVVQ